MKRSDEKMNDHNYEARQAEKREQAKSLMREKVQQLNDARFVSATSSVFPSNLETRNKCKMPASFFISPNPVDVASS